MKKTHAATYSGEFTQVANRLDKDPTPKDEAVYIPAISPGFAKDVYASTWKRELPKGIAASDLNFLNPKGSLLRLSHALSSAGQALRQSEPCIVSERDRSSTILVCDSGGYQIASNRLRLNTLGEKVEILRWLEKHADYAMTLDVPTGSVGNAEYPYATSQECLVATVENLKVFRDHRSSSAVAFLNVLQGNTLDETDAWYNTVKAFEFEGWAFAGLFRDDMYALCRRILIMADERQIQDKKWVHVLGTGTLEVAVLFTALQRSINRHVNSGLRISYDTSSAFRALRWHSAYSFPTIDRKKMTMASETVPDDARFIGSDIKWPWPSPLGDRLTMGDVCVRSGLGSSTHRDTQSNHYVVHHNLGALCSAISGVNRVLNVESISGKYTLPPHVSAAVWAIDEVLRCGTMDVLDRHKRALSRVKRSASTSIQSDYDRIVE